uniref:protein disulfide-isomerase n=1 Tax=Anolis carolinensis TaxID=28377 RepID=H9GMA6_ANOCA|nr:PREDICTED: protein disulfide-isomerase A2 [Anolis carolinensis]|eukprot:XP_003230231.1 PREDICTED: protein disulfide-isomerase A2 [Anolis carolinensis]
MGHFPGWMTLMLIPWLTLSWVRVAVTQETLTPTEGQQGPSEGRTLSGEPDLKVEEEEEVLVLNQQGFTQALQENRLLLVLFHAPWSDLCQALAPEYAKAAALLREERSSSSLRLASVDGTQEPELRQEFGVAGFPAFKLFREGDRSHPIDYKGEREAEAIVAWMRRKAKPSAPLLTGEEEATAFLATHPVAAVGFFHDPEGQEARLFCKVACDMDDDTVAVALTDRPALFDKYGVLGETVALFRWTDTEGSDAPRVDFLIDEELGLDEAELAHFLAVQSLEPVVEFTNQNSSRIFGAKVPNHLVLFLNKTEGPHSALLEGFRGAAPTFRNQVLFVLANVGGDGASLLHFFGLKSHQVPALRFIHIETNQKYLLDMEQGRDLSASDISTFCQDVLEGRVQPHFMSEEPPSDWDQRPVKTLVGQTFEQVALDESKDVFVRFYAPWCPHSKAMAPAWEQLGQRFDGRQDVLIAEMDATANEVPGLPIRAFPTLYFFPAGKGKEMTEYRGDRDLDSLLRFLENGGETPPVEKPPETPKEEPKEEGQAKSPEPRDEL